MVTKAKFAPALRGGTWMVVLALVTLTSCKTKSEIRREQELARLKSEIRAVRGNKADASVAVEELRGEVARLANVLEERAQYQTMQFDSLRQQIDALNTRMQALEQQAVKQQLEEQKKVLEQEPATFKRGRDLFQAGKFEEAASVFREVIRKSRPGTTNQSHFLLAESLFAANEFALAAIEFAEFKKRYPRDPGVAKATFRQAQCFQKMSKTKEARLFFQEVVDRYPKSQWAASARRELK